MDSRLRRLLSPAAPPGAVEPLSEAVRRPLLVVAGLACGASPAFFGYFDMSVWGPIALGLIAVAVGLIVARPAVPSGIAALAVGALALFAVWSLLSMGWAESADRALTEGDRWILYAVFLLVVVLLMADRRDGEVFVFAATAAVLCVAGYDVIQMLGGDGPSLFGGSRLLEPLGYINGMGGFFLLGFWPLIAAAERARQPALAGLSAGGATLLAALVLLTDSRGTAFAFAASALVVLVLVPGRNRRAWLLLTVLAALALAWGPLTDVTQVLPHGQFAPPQETIERAAQWSVGAAAAVALFWAGASAAVGLARSRPSAFADNLPRISATLLAGLVLLALLAPTVAVKHPGRRVSEQYDAFTELNKVETGVRFTSGGGNRYDYWRIAWHQFTDHPLDGVGAGNFDRTYFLERRTDEDVRQAHSIELQALGETGLIGALILTAFIGAVFAGLWRRARSARRTRPPGSGLTVAAAGMFFVWLAQTSVDWLHLIPGLTGLALGAAAVLLLPVEEGEGGAARRLWRLPPIGTALALALAIAAIVFIGRPTLAGHLRSEAKADVATNPRAALGKVGESLSLNGASVQAYYLKAAALARLGAYLPARAALLEAIDREPHNYVSWALLGDLTTRRGAIDRAMAAYRRASLLNPRDRELRLLGSRRGLVVRLHRHPGSAAALPEAGG